MRRLSLVTALLVFVFVLPAMALAASHRASAPARPPAGVLSIEGARGVVAIRGNGGLLGRIAKGTVELVDLSPSDQWRPTVNGVTRGRKVFYKGASLSFRILGGDYRVTVKGEGISISARGDGVATLLGTPGPLGDTGIYAAGLNADCQDAPDQCQPIPAIPTRVLFGVPEAVAPSVPHP